MVLNKLHQLARVFHTRTHTHAHTHTPSVLYTILSKLCPQNCPIFLYVFTVKGCYTFQEYPRHSICIHQSFFQRREETFLPLGWLLPPVGVSYNVCHPHHWIIYCHLPSFGPNPERNSVHDFLFLTYMHNLSHTVQLRTVARENCAEFVNLVIWLVNFSKLRCTWTLV